MAVIMLSFMRHMYTNSGVNIAIYAGSVALFAASLFVIRDQTFVEDVAWMKASIALFPNMKKAARKRPFRNFVCFGLSSRAAP
ncbi:hypothetical protein [Celeribacter sp. PS-C1]|uniref:hypothetical protein n=1 Tax=Celeribacter sp. PS-C1 TaxID=2820813 RepID=UPI001CA4B9DD|nr:hypothetical protein [Celeribacter sp. PS-C1]MBW6416858.1 hypothetical protein [Celeribacter sp. PS-C1]